MSDAVSTISRAEVCRRISERLEGKTAGALSTVGPPPDGWQWFGIHHSYTAIGLNHYEPVPLDYFTSEDASARLLEAMPNGRIKHGAASKTWTVEYNWVDKDRDRAIHFDRKTAIVLAAMKWLGIEGELDLTA